jgi:TonB dependent receptor
VYKSKIYGGTLLAANQGTSLPSYWRFDAFAEAKLDKNWTAKLFVNNIFNKLYYDAFGITDVAARMGEGISGMMPVRGSPPQVAIIVKLSVFPSRKERKKAGYDIEVSISSIAVASAAVSPFRRRCLSTMRR